MQDPVLDVAFVRQLERGRDELRRDRGCGSFADRLVLLQLFDLRLGVAEFFEDLAVNGAVDGIVMAFQDFLLGLRTFGDKVMPLMRRRGIEVGLD